MADKPDDPFVWELPEPETIGALSYLNPLDRAALELTRPMVTEAMRKTYGALYTAGLMPTSQRGGVERLQMPTPPVMLLAVYMSMIEVFQNAYGMDGPTAKKQIDTAFDVMRRSVLVAPPIGKGGRIKDAISKALEQAFNSGIKNTEAKEKRDAENPNVIPFPANPNTKH